MNELHATVWCVHCGLGHLLRADGWDWSWFACHNCGAIIDLLGRRKPDEADRPVVVGRSVTAKEPPA